MIDCSEFLELYSEFRDELLPEDVREDLVLHLALCASCARYHRVIHKGVETLRHLPEVSPSEDFLERLERELIWAGREPIHAGAPVGLVVALAVAIGAAAWLPTLSEAPHPTMLPAAVAHAPRKPEVLPLEYRPVLLPSPSWFDRTVDQVFVDHVHHTLLGTPDRRVYTQVAQFGR